MRVPLADFKATRGQRKLVDKVLRSGRLTYGDVTRQFEEQFAALHGAKHALFTSSGTDALKIAIGALKVKYHWHDGDEILIPATTFVATANAVLMNNLTPVLVDIEIVTLNIDIIEIEKRITHRTKAILPVHLLGYPTEMYFVKEIAKKHRLKIIEDSCETMLVNRLEGDVACFSTYMAHLLVTGVGGFIITNDDKLAKTMRSMMFHGRDEGYLSIDDRPDDIHKRYHFPRFGYSDRATEMEAALGLEGLKTLKADIVRRQVNASLLYNGLSDIGQISISQVPPQWSSWMFFPILAEKRDLLAEFLEKRGIETRSIMPLINQPVMRPYARRKFPVAQYVLDKGLLIGCHQYLTKKQINYVVDTIKEFYDV